MKAVRAARRRPNWPIEEDDLRNAVFKREIEMLLRMTNREALPGGRTSHIVRD